MKSIRLLTCEAWCRALISPGANLTLQHGNALCHPANWKGTDDVLDAHLFFAVESGRMRGVIGGNEIPLEEGTVLWMPPGTRRQISSVGNKHGARTRRLRFRLLQDGHPLTPIPGVVIRREAWELTPCFQVLHGAESRPPGDGTAHAIAALALRMLNLPEGEKSSGRTFTAAQRAILHELTAGAGPSISPAAMAQALRLTHDYFSRVFRATFGLAPRTWILHERIRRAAGLFEETTLSIKEVVAAVGGGDAATFTRQFCKVMGTPPGHYRKDGRY